MSAPAPAAAVRALVRVSAAIGARWPESRLQPLLAEAARSAAAHEVEEALLQSYLFVGYPGALRALAVWRGLRGAAEARGNGSGDPQAWEQRGERVCREVYGGTYDRLRQNMAALHPDLGRWMIAEGYGKVLGRPGLTLARRELCIVALLAAQEAAEQLYSHLRGALRTGASAEDVEAVLVAIGEVIGPAPLQKAHEVWAAVRARSGE